MRPLSTWITGLALLALVAAPSFAGGTATRGPSMRGPTTRGAGATGSGGAVQFRRQRSPEDYLGGRGYRRSPDRPKGRGATASRGSLMQRAAGEAFGYKARDGATLGAGRWNAERYDSPRDKVIAGNRGRRVVNFGSRVGGAVRRILTP